MARSRGTRSNVYWDGKASPNGPVAGDLRPAWIKEGIPFVEANLSL